MVFSEKTNSISSKDIEEDRQSILDILENEWEQNPEVSILFSGIIYRVSNVFNEIKVGKSGFAEAITQDLLKRWNDGEELCLKKQSDDKQPQEKILTEETSLKKAIARVVNFFHSK
jgi:hypothetical protein